MLRAWPRWILWVFLVAVLLVQYSVSFWISTSEFKNLPIESLPLLYWLVVISALVLSAAAYAIFYYELQPELRTGGHWQ